MVAFTTTGLHSISNYVSIAYYQIISQVKNLGDELKPIPALMSSKQLEESDNIINDEDKAFRNISLQMHTHDTVTWWEVLENCNNSDYSDLFAKLPYADCVHNMVVYTFSDKLFPKTLSIFTAGG